MSCLQLNARKPNVSLPFTLKGRIVGKGSISNKTVASSFKITVLWIGSSYVTVV